MELKTNFNIEGLVELQPRIFKDDRGQFVETYNEKTLESLGFTHSFVQDNQSISQKGTFRGIHMQSAPYAQGKLVRVIKGSVVDYAIDLRPNSPTFGHWASVLLKGEWANQFYIPEGFGHAFLALEDDTIFAYKCTNVYNKESEIGLKWNDPAIGLIKSDYIKNTKDDILVSEKDEQAMSLEEYVRLHCSSL
jgi:dTDP-4-dehydrorhamnose 3,5-epimerase